MKARWPLLLLLPLAAVVVGEPLRAPRLRPRLLAEAGETPCLPAIRYYLEAYAYAAEAPEAALRLLRAAETIRRSCEGDTLALATRIEALRTALRAAGTFPPPSPAPR